MTTSAPPIDHASHIKNISGLFANYYYTQLHKSPSQLFMMYSKNARLTHTVIPEGVEQLSINKDESESVSCSTLEDIKKFYETSYATNSKVCIHSIDHQSITGNSVLITISGLIALTDTTPVYTFTQTFILTPESNTSEKTYLIANDIFRLIPNDDFESESEVVSEEQKVEAPIFETETAKVAVEGAPTESTPNSEQSATAAAAAAVVEEAKVDALKPEVEEKKEKEEPAVEEQEEDVEEEEVKPRAETSAESKTELAPKTKEKTETKQKSKNEGKSKSEKDKEEHKQKAKESSPKTESKQDSKPHAKKETSPVKSEESPQPSKEEHEQAKEEKEEEKEQASEQVEKQEEEEEKEEEKEEIVKENVKPKQPIPNTWAALASSAASLPVRSATGSPATQSPKPRAVKPTDSTNASAASAKQAKTTKTTKPLGNITNSQKPSSSERGHKGSFLYGVVLNNVNDLKGPEIKELVERTIGPTIKVEPKGRFCTIAFETEASQKKALSVKSITDHNNVIFTFTKITSDTNFKPRSNNGSQKTNGSSSQGSGQRKRNTGTNGRN